MRMILLKTHVNILAMHVKKYVHCPVSEKPWIAALHITK